MIRVRNLQSLSSLSASCELRYGEYLLAIDTKKRKKLFKLKEGNELHLHTGKLEHNDIQGCTSGKLFRTHRGSKLAVRRPSLEEYVLLMCRGANIAYPKDIWNLIGMLDIGPGSKVVEAGTGSGALTLHLSRVVGERGTIMSFEVNKKHLDVAMENYSEWVNCVRFHGDKQRVENVAFYNKDLTHAEEVIDGLVDAVALDLPDPSSVIHTVYNILKPGAMSVVYLPNISQIIHLSEQIRRKCILLQMETVYEVIQREWTVQPASLKHQLFNPLEGVWSDNKLMTVYRNDTTYIARPNHYQSPHTAFLVKLRKLYTEH